MKYIKSITALMIAASMVVFSGCKKKDDSVKMSPVTGTVTYYDGASASYKNAPGAFVNVTGGATTTVAADASGKYNIPALMEGSYTFNATYTDSTGFQHISSPYSVTIGTDEETLTVDMKTK